MYHSILKFMSGIPDVAMMNLAALYPRRSNSSYEDYLAALQYYGNLNWVDGKDPFIRLPSDSAPMTKEDSQPFLDGEELRYSYPSRYVVHNQTVEDAFFSHKINMAGSLNLWRHGENGTKPPIVLCLHGFLMGDVKMARKMFKVQKLFDMGLDSALFVLPHHGRRTSHFTKQYFLNPENIPLTVETFGQCLHDLHSVILWLRSQGYERIGILGASLGGYSAALYTTICSDMDFAFMVVPAVNFQNFFIPREKYFDFVPTPEMKAATIEALNLVTPENHQPKLNVEKMSVVLHAHDKMNLPELTRNWISKWGIENCVEVPGGHWIYADHRTRGKTWYTWLQKMGYCDTH